MSAMIRGVDIQAMVAHWLATPVYGYLGSDYGADLLALLHTPQASGIADGFIAKMVKDLPVLSMLPAGSINVFSRPRGDDGLDLFIDVAGMLIPLGAG